MMLRTVFAKDGRSRSRALSTVEGFSLEPRLTPSVDVLTYHNDNARTGENLNETALTPANVNPSTFGKLGQVAVGGQVYAQPLIKTGVAFPDGSTHDVVYVATEHDSVYAFDADTLAPLWHDSFINPALGITPAASAGLNSFDIVPEIGITGTPVIDPSTDTLFVVTTVQAATGSGVAYIQQLHALDLATGAEKLGGPVTLQATVPGTGVGAVHGKISFNPKWEFQRSALLLVNGSVYIAFASHSDNGPYHGWVLGYNALTLRQTAAYDITPSGSDGGIWMGGGGPAADASGYIYLSSGNGSFKAGRDYGDSVVKLAPAKAPNGLAVVDYYTPYNQAKLQAKDLDLGSGGVLLLPDQPSPRPHLLLTGGKEGRLYLINRDNMGRYVTNPKKERTVQQIPNAVSALFSTPAYFNGTIYVVGAGERVSNTPSVANSLRAFSIVNGRINPVPQVSSFTYGYPGSTPSISANGSANGIVWTLDNGGAYHDGAAILRAYAANDVTHELYDSTLAGTRDTGGLAVKFTVPTVANGRVYVGGSGVLTLYGLFTEKSG